MAILEEIKKSLESLAIQINELAVGEHSEGESGLPVFKSQGEIEGVICEPLYLPNTEDAHGNWMSTETVKSLYGGLRKGYLETGESFLNFCHEWPIPKSEVEVIDIGLTTEDMVLKTHEGIDKVVPTGTCTITKKYHNKQLLKARLSGLIGGSSIELYAREG